MIRMKMQCVGLIKYFRIFIPQNVKNDCDVIVENRICWILLNYKHDAKKTHEITVSCLCFKFK